jgi:hypothetical protein
VDTGLEQRQERKQIPKGNDRKKGKSKDFDAKVATVATFRQVERAKANTGVSPLRKPKTRT